MIAPAVSFPSPRRDPSGLVTLLVAAALGATSCAPALFVPPAGAGAPDPTGQAAWTAASRACRDVHTYRGQFVLSGQVGGHRVPHIAVALAVDDGGRLAIDARYGGGSVFALAGSSDTATLVLSDGNRMVTAHADDILNALVGIKIGPARLVAILAGCVTAATAAGEPVRYAPDLLAITAGETRLYLSQRDARWAVRAGTFGALEVDYHDATRLESGVPASLTIASGPLARAGLGITLRLDDPTPHINPVLNGVLNEALFRITPPPGAVPMSLDDLAATGPLSGGH